MNDINVTCGAVLSVPDAKAAADWFCGKLDFSRLPGEEIAVANGGHRRMRICCPEFPFILDGLS